MKKRRGMSYDQKKTVMLKIFHETKSVFNYQQIEKVSGKAGIPYPNVKEILTALRADSLIECEKIGAGVYYWAFPSKAIQIFEEKIQLSQQRIASLRVGIDELCTAIHTAQKSREGTPYRQAKQEEMSELQKEEQALMKKLECLTRYDPERYQLIHLEKQNAELLESVNTQTDNIEQIKKYIKSVSHGIKDSQIQQAYGIPANIDYLE